MSKTNYTNLLYMHKIQQIQDYIFMVRKVLRYLRYLFFKFLLLNFWVRFLSTFTNILSSDSITT